jgi:hypothetical protein
LRITRDTLHMFNIELQLLILTFFNTHPKNSYETIPVSVPQPSPPQWIKLGRGRGGGGGLGVEINWVRY